MLELKFLCYKDKTILTTVVQTELKAIRATISTPVVFGLQDELTDEQAAEFAKRHPIDAPLVIHVDGEDGAQAAPRAHANLVRLLEARSRGGAQEKATAEWTIEVLCPSDECSNMFDSATVDRELARGAVEIEGRPPSDEDAAWKEAAKEIHPAKSLAHASDSAKYVVANVSVIALVLGGLGIYASDLLGGFLQYPWAFYVVVILAAVALIFSVIALFPRSDNVHYDNLAEVRTAYRRVIEHRTLFAKSATQFLIGAIIAALIAFLLPRATTKPSSSFAMSWDGSVQNPVLSLTIETKDLVKNSEVRVVLLGIGEGGKETELSSSRSEVQPGGTAKLEEKVVAAEAYDSYKAQSTIIWDNGERKRFQDMVFLPPPVK